jgi:hypothetical protein
MRGKTVISAFIRMWLTMVMTATAILLSCNYPDPSPYADIVSKPPFAELTDSIRDQPGDDELYFRRAVLLNKNNYPEPALADFKKAWSLRKQEKHAFGITNLLLEKKPDSAIIFMHLK